MPTLLAIDTHEKVSDFLVDMWPHYEKAGVDILGIERTNRPTRWPKDVKRIAVGEDLFQRWCEHRSPTLLCNRMLDSFDRLLHDGQFSSYTDFCLSTWSVLFAKALPQPMPALGLAAFLTGLNSFSMGFRSPYLFHYPVWFNRSVGERLLNTGRELMAKGWNEMGANDFLLGLMIATACTSWENVPAYTANGLDTPAYIEEARKSLHNGAWWIGNIKNKGQLEALLA